MPLVPVLMFALSTQSHHILIQAELQTATLYESFSNYDGNDENIWKRRRSFWSCV